MTIEQITKNYTSSVEENRKNLLGNMENLRSAGYPEVLLETAREEYLRYEKMVVSYASVWLRLHFDKYEPEELEKRCSTAILENKYHKRMLGVFFFIISETEK